MNESEMEKQRGLLDERLAVVKRMQSRYPSFKFSFEDKDENHWLLVGTSLHVRVAVNVERVFGDLRPGAKIEYQRGPVFVNGNEISTEQRFVGGTNTNGPSRLLFEELGLTGLDKFNGNSDPETWFDHGVLAAAGFLERQLDALKPNHAPKPSGTAR